MKSSEQPVSARELPPERSVRASLRACTAPSVEAQLLDTRCAFDSVAADYDGPRGNNDLIQRMRRTVWETALREFPAGSRLLDLGCGTGIDALEFARHGHRVVATDWSAAMVERTRARVAAGGLLGGVEAGSVGRFDAAYSNFGPLNCAPDLKQVASECARLVRPGGKLVFSVIGRICPWEIVHYTLRGRIGRACVRAARGPTAVGMNRHTIWTRYYLPREFHRAFAAGFRLQHCRALGLFVPPPYLVDFYRRHRNACEWLGRLEDRLGALPLLRNMGDHFLIVMQRR